MKTASLLALLCAIQLSVCAAAGALAAGGGDVDNPLLSSFDTPFGVPPFDQIRPEHFIPAFLAGMERQTAEVARIVDAPEAPNYRNTVVAYFQSGELLGRVSNIFDNTTGANTNAAIQKVAEAIRPRLAGHRDALTLDPRLFARIRAVHDGRVAQNLDPSDAYLLERLYESFVQNGALLPTDRQERLKAINRELASLTTQFDDNLLAETNDWRLVVDKPEDLAGLSEEIVATAAEAAAAAGLPGKWVFTTQKPSMIPFLQYAHNRELRRQIYTAYCNRGNNGDAKDNKAILARIVALRAEKANLLGFASYAAYKLQTRMAGTPEKTFELLDALWEKALPVARREAAELQALIDQEQGAFPLAAWDWWYYAEKLRKAKYDLDENELRPYFPVERVRDGMFEVANRLYGLVFLPLADLPAPHPDAQAYEVRRADDSHLGVLYLDFFPRESKEGGAWCLEYRGRHVRHGQVVAPITTMVCNLTRPTQDTPALLSMDDTETLFHEFGHALESLLAETPYATAYYALDFTELPSQIMEHWAFHPEVLPLYARHYRTGEAIPEDLIARIHKASLFNQGFATTEYLAAALLDLGYHGLPAGATVDVANFEQELFARRGLIPEIVSRYRSTYFGHIMGGYDAGYYSYIWSSVLDSDAFDLFRERGVFDRDTADSFRRNILARDGTADPMAMFVAFRGREPAIEPLLRKRGLM